MTAGRPLWRVENADCLDAMAAMEPCSVDAVVTDPPYGLAFMGKSWDHAVPGPEFFAAMLRVAKPGAHLVAFGGTRLYHRMTCAIEDAGWEVRDCLMWLYGSGFPKSLDVSKAIDRMPHRQSEVLALTAWIKAARDAKGLSNADIDAAFGFNGMAGHWTSQGSQPAVPTREQFAKLLGVLGDPDLPEDIAALVGSLNDYKGQPGAAWFDREVVGSREMTDTTKARPGFSGAAHSPEYNGEKRSVDITAPASDAAKQWHGWGTALKPAWEPIVLARKPLGSTVAACVTEHGTGALNINGCLIGDEEFTVTESTGVVIGRGRSMAAPYTERRETGETRKGRWPANLVLDDAVADRLPDGAGRYFYSAKASRSDREAGLDASPAKTMELPDAAWATSQNPYLCGGATERSNTHPTVKPTDLMRWLVRLVTPAHTDPPGLVLDPFCGSGSTGVAAVLEGCRFVGCEREPEYAEIARARIAHAEARHRTEHGLFAGAAS